MTFGNLRHAKIDPPPFTGSYLAEDSTFGWQVMQYDANRNVWRFTAPSGWPAYSLPTRWTDLPPRNETDN